MDDLIKKKVQETFNRIGGGIKKDKYTQKELLHYMTQAIAIGGGVSVVGTDHEGSPDKVSVSSSEVSMKRKPQRIKKGDVFNGSSINFKHRPFVVAKVTKEGCYCIPLTSSDNEYALVKTSSRFFNESSLCNHMVLVEERFILQKFVGILDDNTSLNKAIKSIVNTIKINFL